MSNVIDVDFVTRAEEAWERRHERNEQARIGAEKAAKEEIRAALTAAMAGLGFTVPGVHSRREIRVPTAEAVQQALDAAECVSALAVILARSDCPLVADLRKLIVKHYVLDTFEGLVEARGY